MKTNIINDYAELAFQFGPFFFALLFTLVISRWTYRIYNKCCLRQESTDSERDTFRWVFLSTTGFGICMVIASVIWWWNRPMTYVFEGEIRGLEEYQHVTSSTVFFRSQWNVANNGMKKHNAQFIAVQHTPFFKGQRFEFFYDKGLPQDAKIFSLRFNPDEKSNTYQIVFSDSADVLAHIHDSISEENISMGTSFLRFLFNTAFAKGSATCFARAGGELHTTKKSDYGEAIEILQDEYASVGSKLRQMGLLMEMKPDQRVRLLTTRTEKEDMILTIIDLTRHNDRELAYRAERLAESIDVKAILGERLVSDNPLRIQNAMDIIRRLDRKRALEIVESVKQVRTSYMRNFIDEIFAGRTLTPLVPTGSSGGDRYYIKAEWSPRNREVEDCLTRLFNRELLNRPSLKREAELMRGRGQRIVYWYSKEWALMMASKIRSCGGAASFVHP